MTAHKSFAIVFVVVVAGCGEPVSRGTPPHRPPRVGGRQRYSADGQFQRRGRVPSALGNAVSDGVSATLVAMQPGAASAPGGSPAIGARSSMTPRLIWSWTASTRSPER